MALAPIAKWKSEFSRTFRYYLDRSTPHLTKDGLELLPLHPFTFFAFTLCKAFISYPMVLAVGIYILNLLIGFLSPQVEVEPELEVLDGASLPTKVSDEFKPFIRRLPEFKFL